LRFLIVAHTFDRIVNLPIYVIFANRIDLSITSIQILLKYKFIEINFRFSLGGNPKSSGSRMQLEKRFMKQQEIFTISQLLVDSESIRYHKLKFRFLSCFLIMTVLINLVFFSPNIDAQSTLNLPQPGTMIATSPVYNPTILAGLTLYSDNPMQFDFIMDPGDDYLNAEALNKESQKLINYFMATLTIPEEEMWVNLSPYEKDRIIAKGLGETELGRDMLAQDYILKQLTASMMYPEDKLGRQFWKLVYAKIESKFGPVEISTNTFNKIWIIPKEAVVYVNGTNIFIVDSHLKVMLEEDYLALANHDVGLNASSENVNLSKDIKTILRDVFIPEIEREVNEGKNFANLRQIYHSMILATWYKNNLKESLLGQVYVNRNKIKSVAVEDKQIINKIYNQYVMAFKKGVYSYIQEDYDSAAQKIIPRKYFSGGEDFAILSDDVLSEMTTVSPDSWLSQRSHLPHAMLRVKAQSRLKQTDVAMLMTEIKANLKREGLRELIEVQERKDGGVEFVPKKEAFLPKEQAILFSVIDNPNDIVKIFNGIHFKNFFDKEFAKVSFYKALFQAYIPKDFTKPHTEWRNFLEAVDGPERSEGSIFANQKLLTKIQKLQQNSYYEQYGAWFRKVKPLLAKKKNPKILIIGPGSGNSIIKARDALPDAEITALDIEPKVIRRLKDQGLGNNLVIGDGAKTFFENQSFDIITVEGVLRYVATRGQDVVEQLAKELKRLIKQDGIIYIHDGLIPQLMGKFSQTLRQQELEVRNREREYSAHRHTIFRILYYEYFIKENKGIRATIDAMMQSKGLESSETISLLFELAGYKTGVMNSIEAINFNNPDFTMIDLIQRETMHEGNEMKSFSIPADWTIAPNEIFYEEDTDPSRTQLPTKYAVAVVMMDEAGKVFFAQRNPELGSVWSLPSSEIESENDPRMLAPLKEKVQKYLGVELLDIELMGKLMSYRMDEEDGTEWQLLMHVVFAKLYKGKPYQTGYIHSTGQPKYTEVGFFPAKEFLTTTVASSIIRGGCACTKSFATIAFGSYSGFEEAFYADQQQEVTSQTTNRTQDGVDNALMTAPGGIDFNANNLSLKSLGEQFTFKRPANLEGLRPSQVDTVNTVIIDIVPIINFPLLILD